MTVEKVLADLEEVLPNIYTTAKKVEWLNEIDKKIYEEVVKTHEGYEDVTLATYVVPDEEVEDQQMLVPEPYSVLYLYFLMTKVHFFNAEYERYNNSAAMHNQSYIDFLNWYNSNHLPIQTHIKIQNTDNVLVVPELDI